MRRSEQNRNNYGMNPQNQNRNRSMGPGKGLNRNNFNSNYDQYASGARNSEWNNTDEHFSFDHDNNYDTSSKYNDYNSSFNDRGQTNSGRGNSNFGTDFDDEGLATRSHRMSSSGWDRPGMHSSNQGMRGSSGPRNFGTYGYSDTYDSDIGQQGLSDQWNRSSFVRANPDRGGHYGKGPKGYRRSDDRIKEDVCEALYAHSEIDASNVEVSVKEGAVTLSGTVDSRDIKRKVESAIENLSGVDDVQNDLKVSKSSGSTTSSSSTTSIRNQKLA